MKRYILLVFIVLFGKTGFAQSIDSLFFNLYTDSLKKGTHNYINVVAKYKNGSYLPLNENEIEYNSTAGKFERSSLWIPLDTKDEKITITIKLKSNKTIAKSVVLYIKKKADNEPLRTKEEILADMQKGNKPSSKKSKKNKTP